VFDQVLGSPAACHLPATFQPPLINIGCGEDLTIRELAELVKDTVGVQGPLVWDTSKPDGTPRKLMDVSRLSALGWRPRITLHEGLRRTYQDFQARFGESGSVAA
jgi:GDP-L-fucose synthase